MSVFSEKLDLLRREGLYRSMRLVEGVQDRHVMLDGRDVLLFCSNNYLGLAGHPRVQEASMAAVARFGAGSGAARLVSGTMGLHRDLEERLALFKGTEGALLFNSGYAANTGVISAVLGKGDVIFSDRLNHASIVDGALLSRARFVRYPHNDLAALRRLLCDTPAGGRRLIVTDGVFSMDGDFAMLRELVSLKREFDALLMVDDAHGTGVLGDTGRGTAELCGCQADIDIHMGTLGKALGSFGAYVAARGEIIEYLVNTARSFIFSTSLPPAVLAASLAALDIIDSQEGAALRGRLAANTALFRDSLRVAGFDTMGSATQIVPVRVGTAESTMEFTRQLLGEGVFVQGIRPPTVPAGSCRLRCTLMASHEEEDIRRAVAAIVSIGKRLGVVGS